MSIREVTVMQVLDIDIDLLCKHCPFCIYIDHLSLAYIYIYMYICLLYMCSTWRSPAFKAFQLLVSKVHWLHDGSLG